MKKLILPVLALFVLLGCLTGCNFAQSGFEKLADKAEATPKAEEMIAALAAGSTADAKALMHPLAAENADSGIAQMSEFLDGREATAIEVEALSVNTSTGTGGKSKQEQAAYRVTLDDGTVVYVSVVYLSDKQGSGFTAFQVVLGIV